MSERKSEKSIGVAHKNNPNHQKDSFSSAEPQLSKIKKRQCMRIKKLQN
ncbi:hypothetical protein ABC762_03740 [Staphylococcus ureilyticus]